MRKTVQVIRQGGKGIMSPREAIKSQKLTEEASAAAVPSERDDGFRMISCPHDSA